MLSNKVTLYIPSTIDVDIPVDSEAMADNAVAFLACKYGGATAMEATGAWCSSEGVLVKEKVTLVYAFSSCLSEQDLLEIEQFACSIKRDMRQESVAYEVNGSLYFV